MLQRTTVGDQAIVQTGEGAALHAGDLRPAFIKVQQATSRGDATPGLLVNGATEEAFDELAVVPIMVQPTRTKWPSGGYSADRDPECWSNDGMHGAMGTEERPSLFPGAPCVSCKHYTVQPWVDKASDGWCQPAYVALLMDAMTHEPLVIRLTGTMAKSARFFASNGVLRKAVVSLTTRQVETPQGKWFGLVTKTVERLNDEDAAEAAQMLKDFAGQAFTEEQEPVVVAPEPPTVAEKRPLKAETPKESAAKAQARRSQGTAPGNTVGDDGVERPWEQNLPEPDKAQEPEPSQEGLGF